MAWTTPRTWTVDELVTALMMNTHVRDNLNALWPYTNAEDLAVADSSSTLRRLALGSETQALKSIAGALQYSGELGWSLRSTADQTITNTNTTTVTFSTEDFDSSGFHAAGNTVTIPADMSGFYIVNLKGAWKANSSVSSGLLQWIEQASDNALIAQMTLTVPSSASMTIAFSVQALHYLTAGETYSCKVHQRLGGGASLDLLAPIYFNGIKVA